MKNKNHIKTKKQFYKMIDWIEKSQSEVIKTESQDLLKQVEKLCLNKDWIDIDDVKEAA